MNHKRSLRLLSLLLLVSLLAPVAAHSQDDDAAYVRSHYTKFEYRIPMRDGAKLFTIVYVPNDRTENYPMLLFRTPYAIGPYGTDQYRATLGPNMRFAREGYIFVYQDVRGRFMSEGTFANMTPHVADKKSNKDIDESTDTYDTIEWLLEHVENHNGRAGQWGVSPTRGFTPPPG
jgi:putative CocE/NonD family hydrolase